MSIILRAAIRNAFRPDFVDHDAPPLMQSRRDHVQIDDHAVRVRTIAVVNPAADARPTLVFLHDSLGCISVWRDFPDVVSAALGCHALVYDRRGYGESSPFAPEPRRPSYLADEAAMLIRVLDATGVGDAVLFGHSDGGSIALLAAAHFPKRVTAVVTEGAHVFVEERTLEGIRAAKELLRTTDLRERLWRHHGEQTDAVTAAWIDVWLSPEFRDWNIERDLQAIHCPVLVLQGVDDEYGTAEQVRAIVDGVRGVSEAHLIAGARHTPHREAREETLRLTTAFLARVVDGPAHAT